MGAMRRLPLAAVFCCTLCAQQATVETRDGNVFFTGAGGQRLQLTSEFRDLFAVLSPDARQVAFVRTGSSSPDGAFGDETTQLCVVEVGLGEPPPKCASVVYQEGEDPLGGFREPQWSADGRSVYFLSDFSFAASGLCRFDAEAGKAAFLAPVTQFALAAAGKWRGMPVAEVVEGDMRSFIVISPEGGRLERVGRAGEKLDAVMARVQQP